MSVVQSSGYCQTCQRQSMFQKPRINHVLHLILTLVTLGIWGVVWLTLGIISLSKGSRCVTCGMKMGHSAPHAMKPPPPASATMAPADPPAPQLPEQP